MEKGVGIRAHGKGFRGRETVGDALESWIRNLCSRSAEGPGFRVQGLGFRL